MERSTKTKERVKKYGEVFTPAWLVRNMLDMLDRENGGHAFDLKKTFIEPGCGTGNFAVQIIGRKLEKCRTFDDVRTAVKSYYSVDIQADNVMETRERIGNLVHEKFPNVQVKDILESNILVGDFLHPKGIWFLEEYEDEFEKIIDKKKSRKQR